MPHESADGILREQPEVLARVHRSAGPTCIKRILYSQLICIHAHQLFRIQYTCFELDTVNIDWWIRIYVCLVL